jgi:formyl-CoA transferase
MGREDLAADSSLATNTGRVTRVEELDEAIAAWTETRTADEVVERLRAQQLPVSRINSIADIVQDPQFIARGAIVEVEDERLDQPLLVPGVIPKLSRTPGVVRPLAQELGEATEQVRGRVDQGGRVGRRGIG